MTSDPFICDLPSDASRPAPGTATLTSLARVTSAECAWDKNPANPDRQQRCARNLDEFLRHISRYRRRRAVS